MRFFIPGAKDKDTAERVYAAIRAFITEEGRAVLAQTRIESITFREKGERITARVGEANRVTGERVFAILFDTSKSLYHVCTMSRGVRQGPAIMVGKHEVESETAFDPEAE